MDNLLDIYTKIKLRTGSSIIVTYYSNDGNKYTEEFSLFDISVLKNVPYISIRNDSGKLINISFMSPETIIESITFKGYNKPIYFNPHLSTFNNPFTNYEQLKKIMENLFIKDESALTRRNKIINTYLAKYGNVLYDDLFFSKKQKEEFEVFFQMLVNELSAYAQKNNFDSNLKKVCSASTSIIYEIGDKIIKIGKPRRTPTIPYCEYILQPIINRDFEFNGYPIHIEVTQKVFALDNKDGYASESEDERFLEITSTLSTKLYSIGLTSDDLHPGNVGILLSDNKIHFESIPFDTGSDKTTSIDNNNSLRILPKGNFVIIDLDSLTIEDQEKYSNYLKTIGYTKNKSRILKLNE